MKKLFFALLIGLFSTALMAQNAATKEKDEKEEKKTKVTVPAAVKDAFAKEFPTVKKVSWDAEDGGFEAEFSLNGTDESATYDKTGHRKEVEVDIKTTELPAAAQEYVKAHYAAYKLVEAAKITNDKNVVTYEAEIGKDGKKWDVLFDATGKFIKQVEGD